MKLPSLQYLIHQSTASFKKFPFVLISAAVASAIGIYLVELEEGIDNKIPYLNLILSAALGIPLYFCSKIYNAKESNQKHVWAGRVVVTFLLFLVYSHFPSSDVTTNTSIPYIRYAIYAIITHLLVATVPYLKAGQVNAFWNYNKSLFIRFVTSLLYSGALFLGITLAMGAVHLLFDVTFKEKTYFQVWILVAGVFNTWFFVTGVPKNLDALDAVNEYPKGLKIFAQYILFPLLCVYLLILYTYGGKIIALWDWPRGMVSYLISGISVLGIFTFLLLFPYGNSKENKWIKTYSKAYYYLLFPLIALLFIAIGMRIGDYGMTINRYIILLLGVWLTLISIYLSLFPSKIKAIPLSLASIIALMSFGPWGMFSLSERSQGKRLIAILNENNLMGENGQVRREITWVKDSLPTLYAPNTRVNDPLVSDSIREEINSILNYLDDHHGFSSIEHVYQQNLDSLIRLAITKNKYINESKIYMNSLGLSHNRYSYSSDRAHYYMKGNNKLVQLDHFEYLFFVDNMTNSPSSTRAFSIKDQKYTLRNDTLNKNALLLETNNDTLSFALDTLITKITTKYGRGYAEKIPREEMSISFTSNNHRVKMVLANFSIQHKEDSLYFDNLDAKLLLTRTP